MKTAFHFLKREMTLGYGDGRKVIPGETLFIEGDIELCKHGLHWSYRAIDALWYASGPIISVVEPVGKIIEDNDKGVSQGRKCIWVADATDVLMEFTRKCALDVVHLWEAPEVVIKYLETGDESLMAAAWNAARAAASAAARDAASAAAWNAARNAARNAASAAASAAARAAARNGAWDSASAAAWNAAWDAASAAASAAVDAAADAAWNAAWNAARERQNARLEEMLYQLVKNERYY